MQREMYNSQINFLARNVCNSSLYNSGFWILSNHEKRLQMWSYYFNNPKLRLSINKQTSTFFEKLLRISIRCRTINWQIFFVKLISTVLIYSAKIEFLQCGLNFAHLINHSCRVPISLRASRLRSHKCERLIH